LGLEELSSEQVRITVKLVQKFLMILLMPNFGVWASVIGSDDVERDLNEVSIPRLQRLGEIVDEVVQS